MIDQRLLFFQLCSTDKEMQMCKNDISDRSLTQDACLSIGPPKLRRLVFYQVLYGFLGAFRKPSGCFHFFTP